MKYLITDKQSVRINETSGTIQNVSNSTVEISNSQDFADKFLLYPLNKCNFDGVRYIRAHGNFESVIEINVAPFFADSVTEDKNSYDTTNRIILTGLSSDLTVNPATGLFEGIEIDTLNQKINVAASVLGAEDITLWTTGEYSNYEFSLGVDVTTYSVTTPEIWQLGNGSVHYNSGTATGGYSVVGGNRIVSLPAVSATSFAISGLPKNSPSVEQITVDSASSEVKLATSAFGKQDSLAFNFSSADHNLALSDDVLKSDYGAAIYTQGETTFECTLLSAAACKYSSIVGTSGDDVISLGNNAMHCTISGGSGNNTIYGNGCSHTYASVGSDKIFGFGADDYVLLNPKILPVELYGNANVVFDTNLLDGISVGDSINVVDGDSTYFAKVLSGKLGTADKDTITNNNANFFVFGLANNDNIINYGANVTIYGGAGTDSIVNYGANVLIYGEAGADTISLGAGSSGTIYGGGGGDSIISASNGGHIYQFKGADASNATITGFKANDTIQFLDDVTVVQPTAKYFDGSFQYLLLDIGNGAALWVDRNNLGELVGEPYNGLQAAYLHGELLNIVDKNGNNLGITTPKVYIANGSNENISVPGDGYYIYGFAGYDTITNNFNYVTIDAGAGNDTVINNGEFVSIYGGSSDDSITTSKGNVTIYGGKGNDTIVNNSSGGVVYQFGASNDSNTITGFKSADKIYFSTLTNIASVSAASVNADGSTISLTGASTSVVATGAAGSFDATKGVTIILKNQKADAENLNVRYPTVRILDSGTENSLAAYNNTGKTATETSNIVALGYNNITNAADGVTITEYGGTGNTFYNTGSNMLLNAGGGTNSSITSSGDVVTIYGGNGNDTINLVNASANTVLAGAGEDLISISGTSSNNTIYGGAGAESIISNGNHNIFWYAGNANESSMTGSENISESIKGFNTDNDKIFVRNTNTTVTSATVEAGAQLTLTNGSRVTNILLEGKGANDTIKFLWASATDERLYAVGSTADNSSGWAT